MNAPTAARCGLAGAVVAVALAVGLWLRVAGADSLFLGSDELHALHAAVTHSWAGVFSYYGPADNCVALTLYAKGLMTFGTLTETTLRLPIMLAGALLLLAPLLFVRETGAAAALAGVALFATSPQLVFCSVFARPYAPATLCVVGLVASWHRWLRDGSRRASLAFALLAAAAVFLHLFCVFPVATLYALALDRARRDPRLRRPLAAAAAVSGLALLALLGPGLPALVATRAAKIGQAEFSPSLIWITYGRLVGIIPSLAWLLLALCGIGLAALCRRAPLLASGIAAVLVVQWLALLVTRPLGGTGSWPRYYALVWPLWLIAAAVGLDACASVAWRRVFLHPGAWQRLAMTGSTAIAALALALWVPLGSPMWLFQPRPNSFRSGKAMVGRAPEVAAVLPEALDAVLAQPDRGEVLLWAPFVPDNVAWVEYYDYQRRHRMQIKMADAGDEAKRRALGIHFRNVIDLRNDGEVGESGARYLVLDLAVAAPAVVEEVRSRFGSPLASDGTLELHRLPRPTSPATN